MCSYIYICTYVYISYIIFTYVAWAFPPHLKLIACRALVALVRLLTRARTALWLPRVCFTPGGIPACNRAGSMVTPNHCARFRAARPPYSTAVVV